MHGWIFTGLSCSRIPSIPLNVAANAPDLHTTVWNQQLRVLGGSRRRVSCFCLLVPRWLSGKESACQCGRWRRCGLDSWVRKIFWRRKWPPAPVFLPEKSHDQGTWSAIVHGVAEALNMTEWLKNNNDDLEQSFFWDYANFDVSYICHLTSILSLSLFSSIPLMISSPHFCL